MTGVVFDIAHWSGHDGPGIRSVVFFKGCPLRCAWCHNPESQRYEPELLVLQSKCVLCGRCITACPSRARQHRDGEIITDRDKCDNCGRCVETCYTEALQISGRRMSARQVMDEIAEDAVFYRNSGGGVTLSGGEPLAQPALAEGIVQGCHSLAIHVAVETCGCVPWSVMECVAPYVDLFLYDLKVIDATRHRKCTGVSNDLVLGNLERLAGMGKQLQVRVPLIPGYTDDDENLLAISEFSNRLGLARIAFLPYNPTTGAKYGWLERDCSLASTTTQSQERLEQIRTLGRSYGLEVQIGG
jgi:pyruvate formate lyase activating enzyme